MSAATRHVDEGLGGSGSGSPGSERAPSGYSGRTELEGRNEPLPAPLVKGFRVQVIAAPTQVKATEMIGRLKGAGYDATIVREGGFYKVRVGPFVSKTEAQAALTKIRARLGGQPFVVADK